MLSLNKISKSFSVNTVLTDISFTINRGDKIALIGANGCGKTTLLKIIAGELKPDSGTLTWTDRDIRLYSLNQNRSYPVNASIENVLFDTLPTLSQIYERIEMLSVQIGADPENAQLCSEFDFLTEALLIRRAKEEVVSTILSALGLAELATETNVSQLSGGQKVRLSLAKALLSEADMLLLDEPTNDLDAEMLAWLEQFVSSFAGAILYASHDRTFINCTAQKTFFLDQDSHKIQIIAGNYDDWCSERMRRQASQQSAWNLQQTEIEQLRKAVAAKRDNARFHKGGKADSNDKFHKAFFANRSAGTMRSAVQMEERLEKLITEEPTSKPKNSWKMKADFLNVSESGEQVIICDDLTVGYDVPLVSDISLTLTKGQFCALIGANGCGKSSVLRTFCGAIPPLSGRFKFGANVRYGLMDQFFQRRNFKQNALETLADCCTKNETEIRRTLSYFLFFGDDVFIPADKISNGQAARLMLACFAVRGVNLLLLDEPMNHMDIESQEQFEEALTAYPGTVLMVTHDRELTKRRADSLWLIADGHLCEV